MYAPAIMSGPRGHSSSFENVTLPNICSTRKSKPGFTPHPRLVELPPAISPT
ncbi:hypothetical protein LZ30DRAFT_573022, partial [Colletotrichum cereale]